MLLIIVEINIITIMEMKNKNFKKYKLELLYIIEIYK